MAKTREEKGQTLKKLNEKLKQAKSIIFADFRGLTVAQITDLRKKLNQIEAEIEVTKNTLLKKALEINKKVASEEIFKGPTATIFGFGDEISPFKIISNFAKEFGMLKAKAGILDSKALSEEDVENLAKLPEKQELIGQTINQIGSPIYGLLNVLEANIRNLIFTLDQKAKS